MTTTTHIDSFKDIERINKVATKQPFNLSVSFGSTIVDARSLLGLVTLIGKCVNITAPDGTDPISFIKAIKRMKVN